MRVRNEEYLRRRSVERMDDKYQNVVNRKKNDIKKLNDVSAKRLRDLKEEGNTKLREQRYINKIELDKELKNKEDQFEKISENFKKYGDQLAKEKELLINTASERIINLEQNNQHRQKEIYREGLKKSRILLEGVKDDFSSLRNKSDLKVEEEKFNLYLKGNDIIDVSKGAVKDLEDRFKKRENTLKRYHERELTRIDRNYKKDEEIHEKANASKKNANKIKNKKELNNLESQHRESIKEEKEGFIKRYDELKKRHKISTELIKKKLTTEINNIFKKHMEVKKLALDRSKDQFYSTQKIIPIIIDNKDHYLIKVNIPEYEKESLHLYGQDREIVITLKRRFQKELNDEKGDLDRIRKSEVLSKRIKLQDIVNPDTVLQNYDSENSILIFKIDKM